jgi:WD40 repeat protein
VEALTQKETAVANEKEANRQAQISRAGELAALSISTRKEKFSLSLLLGIEAYKKENIAQSISTLLENTQANIQLVNYLYGHNSGSTSLAFNHDNTILASSGCIKYNETFKNCEKGEILLYDVNSKSLLGSPSSTLLGDVNSLAFSPDQSFLASGGCDKSELQSSSCEDGEIIFWSMDNFKIDKDIILTGAGLVNKIVFSATGNYLLSVSTDDIIRVWDVSTGSLVSSIKPGIYVESAIFSSDEHLVLAGTADNIQAWDTITGMPGEVLYTYPEEYRFSNVVFSEDGSLAAIGYSPFNGAGSRGWFVIWDLTRKEQKGELVEVPGFITIMVFSPDNSKLSTAIDNSIHLWDVDDGSLISEFSSSTFDITALSFSRESKYILGGECYQTGGDSFDGCSKGEVAWWEIEKNTSGKTMGNSKEINPDNRYFFAPTKNIFAISECIQDVPIPEMDANRCVQYQIDLYDINSLKKQEHSLIVSTFHVESLAFNPKNDIIATINCLTFSEDKSSCEKWETLLWNYQKGSVATLDMEGNDLTFSSDGMTLALSTQALNIWDLTTNTSTGPFPLDPGYNINSILLNLNDSWLRVSINDQVNNSLIINRYPNQPSSITLSSDISTFALSPDSNNLISMGKEIGIWRLSDFKRIATIQAQPILNRSSIQELALSSDLKTIAALVCENFDLTEFFSCLNMKILIWDVQSQKLMGELLLPNNYASIPFGFSSDGNFFVQGNTVWEMSPPIWMDQTCKRVGRNFTRAEWEQYFPNEEYRKTCDQWSLEPEIIKAPTAIP